MKWVVKIGYILVIIGALNWGLVGFFNFNLIETLFGEMSMVARSLYVLVGLSALVLIFMHKSTCCGDCSSCDGGARGSSVCDCDCDCTHCGKTDK